MAHHSPQPWSPARAGQGETELRTVAEGPQRDQLSGSGQCRRGHGSWLAAGGSGLLRGMQLLWPAPPPAIPEEAPSVHRVPYPGWSCRTAGAAFGRSPRASLGPDRRSGCVRRGRGGFLGCFLALAGCRAHFSSPPPGSRLPAGVVCAMRLLSPSTSCRSPAHSSFGVFDGSWRLMKCTSLFPHFQGEQIPSQPASQPESPGR